jgi:nicotinamidase-related amidase
MSAISLIKGKTALLMADFHSDGMAQNPAVTEGHTLQHASNVLEAARGAGIFVAYIVVNFRPGYPEVS